MNALVVDRYFGEISAKGREAVGVERRGVVGEGGVILVGDAAHQLSLILTAPQTRTTRCVAGMVVCPLTFQALFWPEQLFIFASLANCKLSSLVHA